MHQFASPGQSRSHAIFPEGGRIYNYLGMYSVHRELLQLPLKHSHHGRMHQ